MKHSLVVVLAFLLGHGAQGQERRFWSDLQESRDVTASMRREITQGVDAGAFELTQRVEAWDGDQQVFTRDWYARV